MLEAALVRAEPDSAVTLAHVHGFHSYPARLHPTTAAELIAGFSKQCDSVLDPFCGSGTSLVEGRILGRRVFGTDVNPLAIQLATLKARTTTEPERAAWLAAAHDVAQHAEERRERRAGPTRKYSSADRELFDIHVLLELDGVSEGIQKLAPTAEVASVLRLVLSAILTKVSRKPGDTAATRETPRRLASGYTIRLFEKKAIELTNKAAEYARLVPEGTAPPRLWLCDARSLDRIRSGSMQLVVCSPPYPGVYDYFEQHAHRLRWLGLDARGFRAREIGSRSALGREEFDVAIATWQEQLGASLSAICRVLAPGGRALLVIADSVLARRAVYADTLVRALAQPAGLELVCSASQARPHFHAGTRSAFQRRPRAEHVLVLARGRERRAQPLERPERTRRPR